MLREERREPRWFSWLVGGLDRLRQIFWRGVGQGSFQRFVIRERAARVALYAYMGMAFALCCTLFAPLWLLLLAPLILGTPHILSDIRYLLVRPSYSITKVTVLAILLPLGVMTLLRIGMMAGIAGLIAWDIACGCAAILGAIATSRAAWLPKLLLLGGMAYLSTFLIARPWATILALGHLHNLVALGLWLWWSRGEARAGGYVWVVVAYFGAIGLLASGWMEGIAGSVGAYRTLGNGFAMHEMVTTLAPGISPIWGLRLVLIFAFAQAVHYTIWLRLVPNNHHFYTRKAPSTFRRNLDALRADLGEVGFLLAILACVIIPFIGLFDAIQTRMVYLMLIAFHGWLEIAVIAYLLANLFAAKESA